MQQYAMRYLAFLTSLLAAASFGQNISGLTDKQVAKLRQLGKPVVPSYLPPHFKLSTVSVETGDYTLEYKGPNGATLQVQMASEGIGDIDLDTRLDNETPVLGHLTVVSPVFGKQTMDTLRTKREKQFDVNWVDLGAKAKPKFLSIIGFQLSPQEGAKVWKGLIYLKR